MMIKYDIEDNYIVCLSYNELCPPQIHMLKLNLSPGDETIFRYKVFKR